MNLDLSDTQNEIRDAIRKLCEQFPDDYWLDCDRSKVFPHEFHRALARKAIRSLKACYPGPYHLTVLVCDFDGQFIVRVEEEEAL